MAHQNWLASYIKNLLTNLLNGALQRINQPQNTHVARMTIRGKPHNRRAPPRIPLRFIRATTTTTALNLDDATRLHGHKAFIKLKS